MIAAAGFKFYSPAAASKITQVARSVLTFMQCAAVIVPGEQRFVTHANTDSVLVTYPQLNSCDDAETVTNDIKSLITKIETLVNHLDLVKLNQEADAKNTADNTTGDGAFVTSLNTIISTRSIFSRLARESKSFFIFLCLLTGAAYGSVAIKLESVFAPYALSFANKNTYIGRNLEMHIIEKGVFWTKDARMPLVFHYAGEELAKSMFDSQEGKICVYFLIITYLFRHYELASVFCREHQRIYV